MGTIKVHKFFFSQRIVNAWNSLPNQVVETEKVNFLKRRLDKYDVRRGFKSTRSSAYADKPARRV